MGERREGEGERQEECERETMMHIHIVHMIIPLQTGAHSTMSTSPPILAQFPPKVNSAHAPNPGLCIHAKTILEKDNT